MSTGRFGISYTRMKSSMLRSSVWTRGTVPCCAGSRRLFGLKKYLPEVHCAKVISVLHFDFALWTMFASYCLSSPKIFPSASVILPRPSRPRCHFLRPSRHEHSSHPSLGQPHPPVERALGGPPDVPYIPVVRRRVRHLSQLPVTSTSPPTHTHTPSSTDAETGLPRYKHRSLPLCSAGPGHQLYDGVKTTWCLTPCHPVARAVPVATARSATRRALNTPAARRELG
mmetsp:Transcript_3851/g.11484  ORF Transcript_3851/g.11484 Transcript_3851/m.11484 type:complete len:227 (+) Transcript_3851:1491-2171(+)